MLELKNISVHADGKALVKGASLSMRPGEIHILMGQNGSGKSSLVNALMGHPKYSIPEGEALLDGENVLSLPTDKRAKAGLFLSMQHLPEIDGVSFVNFLYRANKELTGSEMTLIEFNKYLSAKADEYGLKKDFLRRNVNAGLSGGEKKQSEVFQLALFRPKYAFLDEIDSGVDVDALEKIFGAIEKLRKEGTAFLLITHYGKILDKIAPDFVHIMKDGKVVRSGGPEIAREISEKGFKEL